MLWSLSGIAVAETFSSFQTSSLLCLSSSFVEDSCLPPNVCFHGPTKSSLLLLMQRSLFLFQGFHMLFQHPHWLPFRSQACAGERPMCLVGTHTGAHIHKHTLLPGRLFEIPYWDCIWGLLQSTGSKSLSFIILTGYWPLPGVLQPAQGRAQSTDSMPAMFSGQ